MKESVQRSGDDGEEDDERVVVKWCGWNGENSLQNEL